MCREAANVAGGNVINIAQADRRLPHNRGKEASATKALQQGKNS
jgi:hypothetical protein